MLHVLEVLVVIDAECEDQLRNGGGEHDTMSSVDVGRHIPGQWRPRAECSDNASMARQHC